ncbi:MAG TPA: hypothetical protein VGK99_12670 [Acidobacteriota bacterium]|jgi:hypothetical protein
MQITKLLAAALLIPLLLACFAVREGRQRAITAPSSLGRQEAHDRALQWFNTAGYTVRQEDVRQSYLEASKIRDSFSGTRNEDVLSVFIEEQSSGTQIRVVGHTYLLDRGSRREIDLSLEAGRDAERLMGALRSRPF